MESEEKEKLFGSWIHYLWSIVSDLACTKAKTILLTTYPSKCLYLVPFTQKNIGERTMVNSTTIIINRNKQNTALVYNPKQFLRSGDTDWI